MDSIVVIGGGPAGMIASIVASRLGKSVTLIEKNEKLGKKLYITGKGRCNLTNAKNNEDLLKHVVSNPKFLYSSLSALDSFGLIDFFEELGLRTKIERGDRVFPASDKSSDVIKTLEKELKRQNVEVLLNTEVTDILINNDCIKGVVINKNKVIETDKVLIATGGLSYSVTGSTGDGYRFAKNFGHTIQQTHPGLVPLETIEDWVPQLQGLSLKNVRVSFVKLNQGKEKVLYQDFGEMLFTHFGVSGPLILSGSSFLPKDNLKDIQIRIDLKPALSFEQLDQRVLKDFDKNIRKHFINSLDELLPSKLIPVIVRLSGIEENRRVDQITKEERKRLVNLLKMLTMTVKKTRDYNEAIITRGGISIKEINASTMESKLVKGLYFAGEVLDVDALTGGYNLQIAFSTGYLAGMSMAYV